MSVGELHNIMASPPEEGGIKDSSENENNIIVIYYALQNTIKR